MSERPEAEWREVTLNQLGEVNRGRSRHRPRYAEHLYGDAHPFIQTGDVKASGGRISEFSQMYSHAGLAQSRLWPTGTMCITIAANIAETGILNFPACFPDSVVGFIADPEKADVHFVEYAFRTLRADLQRQASGSVQDNINLETLARLRFLIPGLPEQRAIADVLGALDDKIAANSNLATSIAEMATMQFTRARHQADRTVRLSELVSTQYGVTTSANAAPGPKLLRVTDINKKPWIDWDAAPNCTVSDLELTKYRVSPGDILVARMADPGKAAFVDSVHPDGVFASYLVRLRPHTPEDALYLFYFLRSPEYVDYAEGAMTGSVQKNMNAKVIVAADLALPGSDAILRFNKTVAPLRTLIQCYLSENRALAATRDALLPQLMSGKLRVKDAEKVLENAGI